MVPPLRDEFVSKTASEAIIGRNRQTVTFLNYTVPRRLIKYVYKNLGETNIEENTSQNTLQVRKLNSICWGNVKQIKARISDTVLEMSNLIKSRERDFEKKHLNNRSNLSSN